VKNSKFKLRLLCVLLAWNEISIAQEKSQSKDLGVVVITSGQPSSLPTQIPTTMESVTAKEILETINATDSEDALKYFLVCQLENDLLVITTMQ